MKKAVNLFLDSGAFSVWRKGEVIQLKDYIEFCQDNLPWLEYIVNLDVIPGLPGKKRTEREVEASAKQGDKNLQRMRKEGLDPIPVFHRGERMYWLEKMLDDGADYIGIGGVARHSGKGKKEWLDEVFSYLCGTRNYPEVKVHGFGVTAPDMMFRYPWYSVDSVSWVLQGGMQGAVFVPPCKRGKFDYTGTPTTVQVYEKTELGATIERPSNAHYRKMGTFSRALLLAYLEEEGFVLEELADSYFQRLLLCARYFKRVAEQYKHTPFRARTGAFWNKEPRDGSKRKPPAFRVYLGTGEPVVKAHALNMEGYADRLYSYADICGRVEPNEYLRRYVKNGLGSVVTKKELAEIK